MKLPLRLLFSIGCCLLLLCSGKVLAQVNPVVAKDSINILNPADSLVTDSLAISTDTLIQPSATPKRVAFVDTTTAFSSKYFLNSIEFGIDYLKLPTLIMSREEKYEVFAGLLFKNRVLLTAEGGYTQLQPENAIKNGEYKVEGVFARAGVDYLIHVDGKSNLSLGVRYGKSFFEDDFSYEINSNLWGSYSEDPPARTNLVASWYEIVAGTETMTRKNLFLGAYLRVKKLMDHPDFEPVTLFAIPGYGKTINRTALGLNLYIKYKLPLRL